MLKNVKTIELRLKGESPYFWWQECHAKQCEDNRTDAERGVTLFLMTAVSC